MIVPLLSPVHVAVFRTNVNPVPDWNLSEAFLEQNAGEQHRVYSRS